MIKPSKLEEILRISPVVQATVDRAQKDIDDILLGNKPHFLIFAGPCSIVSMKQARMVAEFINSVQNEVADTIRIGARVCFQKPRTGGKNKTWKGLISDPWLDGSNDINGGLRLAREILIMFNEEGVFATTEILTQEVIERLCKLVAAAWIGARTSEAQTLREWASGLSMAVGFKNSTNGDFLPALMGMATASAPHDFAGHDNGKQAIIKSSGNLTFLIMRGGSKRPNYDPVSMDLALRKIIELGLNQAIMVDCSHGNSYKKYQNQRIAYLNVLQQRIGDHNGGFLEPNLALKGMILEVNEKPGRNKNFKYGTTGLDDIDHGWSITDECMDFEEARKLILFTHKKLEPIMEKQYKLLMSQK